jgi:endonuclease YncB( thermonuclease family)
MSTNLGNILALLLLSVVGVGGVSSSAAGQNTFLNITDSDIVDLVSNVTESVTETGDSDSSFPFTSDNNNSVADLVSNVTESVTETGDSDSSFPLINNSSISSSSITTTSDTIRINEIELNPTGNDEGKEWIELYNPAEVDINIGNFEIKASSESATIKLPPDAVIAADKTYVLEINQHMLSNTVESLILTDATGNIKDRTPSLVDRSDDERTWQRIPDGNNEWQFVEDTRGNLNDPDSRSTTYDSAYSGSDVKCLGSAGCAEGIAIRIVDADTLYVAANGAVYKVDLALVKAPSRTEERFIESTAFTRDLCLGSTALVDQDDKLQTSNSSVIAVVYCSSSNLNSELLDNGYAELNVEQCAASEFANEPWVKDHGC